VKPYQPEGVWKEVSGATYKPDTGENLHRRSLYTYWKRTAPPPAMLTFDATSREDCMARRLPTNTPLQALVLLNDPQFVEAARMLAQRMITEGGDSIPEQIRYGCHLVLVRDAGKPEVDLLHELYTQRLASIKSKTQNQERAIEKVGTLPWEQGLDRDRLAGMTAVALAILNFDEAIVRR
jgi:hypothetical protein